MMRCNDVGLVLSLRENIREMFNYLNVGITYRRKKVSYMHDFWDDVYWDEEVVSFR